MSKNNFRIAEKTVVVITQFLMISGFLMGEDIEMIKVKNLFRPASSSLPVKLEPSFIPAIKDSTGNIFQIYCRNRYKLNSLFPSYEIRSVTQFEHLLGETRLTDQQKKMHPIFMCHQDREDVKRIAELPYYGRNENGALRYTFHTTKKGEPKYFLHFKDSMYRDNLYIFGCDGLMHALGFDKAEATPVDINALSVVTEKMHYQIHCRKGGVIDSKGFISYCTNTSLGADDLLDDLREKYQATGCRDLWEKLSKVTHLDLRNRNYSDLTAIGKLIHLKSLDISHNNITNIEPLKDLSNLWELNLAFNPELSDLAHLKDLRWLNYLNLIGTRVADLKPLKRLKKIREIKVEWTDVEPKNCPLNASSSYLKKRCGKNIALVKFCMNDYIDSSQKYTADILFDLFVTTTNIKTCYDLANELFLTKDLSLAHEGISDISMFSDFTQLEEFALVGNKITDLTAIESLASLKKLNLTDNHITDIKSAGKLPLLEELLVGGNHIDTLKHLIESNDLKVLEADRENLKRGPETCPLDQGPMALRQFCSSIPREKSQFERACIAAKEGSAERFTFDILMSSHNADNCYTLWVTLENLSEYTFKDQGITSLKPFGYLIKLEQLDVSNNFLTDLSPLAHLPFLRILDVTKNQLLKSLKPLKESVSLTQINIADTKIVDLMPLKTISSLGFGVEYGVDLLTDVVLESGDPPLDKELCPQDAESAFLKGACIKFNTMTFTKACRKALSSQTNSHDFNFFTRLLNQYTQGTIATDPCQILYNTLRNLDDDMIDLTGSSIKTVKHFGYLGNLKVLRLGSNLINDLSGIEKLLRLLELDLSNNSSLEKIEAIANLNYLATLNLNGTRVKNLMPLGELGFLKNLKIPWQNIAKESCPTDALAEPVRKSCLALQTKNGYLGEWVNGLPHGNGTEYSRIGTYNGDWQNGQKNGSGRMDYKNGGYYEGAWVNNMRHGKATYYDPIEQSTYYGKYDDDRQNHSADDDGGALIKWSDTNYYRGGIKNGRYHGKSSRRRKGQIVYDGSFENGKIWNGIAVELVDKYNIKFNQGQPQCTDIPESMEYRLCNKYKGLMKNSLEHYR